MRFRLLPASLAAALVLTMAGAAHAQAWRDRMENRFEQRQERQEERQQGVRVLPLRALIGMVQAQRGGAFVDVVGGLEDAGDRAFYVFRWRYPSGVEENIRVDASNGQVVGR